MRDMPDAHGPGAELSRRQFVVGTGAAAVGAAALSLPAGKAEAAAPQHGGSIKVGLRSDVSRLDPHPLFPPYPTSNAVALLYNGITEVDADANVVPALAHAWETSDDGLTWTWHIRKDVVFHSGRLMTGADVKANLERILNPRTGAIIRGELGIIDRLDLLDDYTLRMTLKYKYYPLPSVLSNRWLPILDPQTFDTAKKLPVGTGPFKLVAWKRLHTTEMVRHADYWEKDADGNALPYLDEITGKPLADDTVRLTALRTGEVDLIEAVSYRDLSRFLEGWGGQFDSYLIKAIGTTWYTFNTLNPPFDDVRVRRAAALALDKRAILAKTLFGHGEIMNQYYSQASPWHLPSMASREQDVDEARRLLDEAGVKPGTQSHHGHLRTLQLRQGGQPDFPAGPAQARFLRGPESPRRRPPAHDPVQPPVPHFRAGHRAPHGPARVLFQGTELQEPDPETLLQRLGKRGLRQADP